MKSLIEKNIFSFFFFSSSSWYRVLRPDVVEGRATWLLPGAVVLLLPSSVPGSSAP